MTLLVLGVLFTGFGGRLDIVAPAVQLSPAKSPPMWPFLFITIACGAISGFHSLVSSGTSAKQVRDEQDSLFVGYGSMLLEGALATLVIIAVSAGIGIGYTAKSGETFTGIAAWTAHYASWASAGGLGNALRAMVDGSANMIATLGISKNIAVVIMGVFVASFAGTTLDTATRIQRYVISELFGSLNLKALTNRYVATAVAVGTALILAFATGASGAGAMKMWPLFGATNQTLASLALIIITLYLKRRGGLKWLVSGIPAVFMTVMTIWALILNQAKWGAGGNMLLTVINICILIIALWIATEGIIKFFVTEEEPVAPAAPETV
jgi:carbon starvation protein